MSVRDSVLTVRAVLQSLSLAVVACAGLPHAHAADAEAPIAPAPAPATATAAAASTSSRPSVSESADAAPLGWLPELAGRCWRQENTELEACYWQAAPGRLSFLSRKAGELIACGAVEGDAGTAGTAWRVRIRGWDAERRGTDMNWLLGEGGLSQHEAPPPYPEGVGRLTIMTRPAHGRYEVARRGMYGAGGRRAGEENIPSFSARYVDVGRFAGDDALALRCLALDAALAPHGETP